MDSSKLQSIISGPICFRGATTPIGGTIDITVAEASKYVSGGVILSRPF
jgi:hypothetical protein